MRKVINGPHRLSNRSLIVSLCVVLVGLVLEVFAPAQSAPGKPPRGADKHPLLIAHRGASAYAPEHTLAAYRLAMEQGADFVEQDLELTRDGRLICLHDPDLARTTNVAEVFPTRASTRDLDGDGKATRGWYTIDFSLAEIRQLDAGSWFNRANPFAARESYAGQRVPTFEEALELMDGRAGLYVEIKDYGFYKSIGYDLVETVANVLKSKGFDAAGKRDGIIIQSFWKSCLLRLRELAPGYTRIQLLPMEDEKRDADSRKITPVLAKEISAYARGAGPSTQMIRSAEDVAVLHDAGLLVHPYTFRGSTSAVSRRPLDEVQPSGISLRESIRAEIQRFLTFGIDGGFTDYPDLWKEAAKSSPAGR